MYFKLNFKTTSLMADIAIKPCIQGGGRRGQIEKEPERVLTPLDYLLLLKKWSPGSRLHAHSLDLPLDLIIIYMI